MKVIKFLHEIVMEYQDSREKRDTNKMSFIDKIKTIRDNKDILTLASDYNWWGVKVKDREIEEQLFDSETNFTIENEWHAGEIHDLIRLLEIDNTDI